MRFHYLLTFISIFINLSSALDISYDEFIRLFSKKEFIVEGRKFTPRRELGTGACGKVLEVKHEITKQIVAMKFEVENCKDSPTYKIEVEVYKDIEGGEGIPKMYMYGSISDKRDRTWHVLVLEKLGKDLWTIFHTCENGLSPLHVVNLALPMIKRIEYLHSKGYIHQDIKPGNFLQGAGAKKNIIYLSDFGYSEKYEQDESKVKYNLNMVGTMPYAPIRAHLGKSQSRRDDLESLGYVLMYFMNGGWLPWDIYEGDSDEKEKVGKSKMETPIEQICPKCPREFYAYLEYVKLYNFEEKPEYKHLYQHFKKLYDQLLLQERGK